MLKKTASSLTAQKLRLILIASISLLLIIGAGMFLYTRDILAGYATDVKKVSNAAEASAQDLAALSTLKTKLSEDRETVERTRNLVADSQSFAYQDQIIKDITTLANKANVPIAGFQFNGEGAASAGAAATTPPPSAGASATAATPQVTGLKTVSVSINLGSPIKYNDIMQFVGMIEQNLTKMQLTGISMNRDTNAADGVSVSALTVEVYVR